MHHSLEIWAYPPDTAQAPPSLRQARPQAAPGTPIERGWMDRLSLACTESLNARNGEDR